VTQRDIYFAQSFIDAEFTNYHIPPLGSVRRSRLRVLRTAILV
jgi:hypothetical protein